MKILISIKHINQASGGAERILCQLASYLSNTKKYDVTIATFDGQDATPFYGISPDVKIVGLEDQHANSKTSPWKFISRILTLRSYLKQNKPDMIISFMLSSMLITALSRIGLGIPMIGSEHNSIFRYENKKIELMLLKLSFLLSNITTVISKEIWESYPGLNRRLTVIPNPIEFSPFKIYPESKLKKTMINTGRLTYQKNQATLVKAMAIVKLKHPDWILNIFGTGEKFDELNTLIIDLRLEKNVFLKGSVKNIFPWFLESDFVVFPSHFEGYPLALAEALSAGLPAIGYKGVAGVDGMITAGMNGELLETDKFDHESLANAMIGMIEKSEILKKYSYNSSHTIEANRPDRIFAFWDELILNYI